MLPKASEIKGTAFGICFIRTLLSYLPLEAGNLRYDPRTPSFEGIALTFHPNPEGGPWGSSTTERAKELANNFSTITKDVSEDSWGGTFFNFCRAHTVDKFLLDCLAETSQVRQLVVCGVGQDYRCMRYGQAIMAHGAKVFELDLPPMMEVRKSAKQKIMEVNPGLELPETYDLSIDFGKEKLSDVLSSCPGFDSTLPTAYLWEGVSYYLQPKDTDLFFKDVHQLMMNVPSELRRYNKILFDHLIDLPKLAQEGDKPAAKMLEVFEKFEPLSTFLPFDKVESYLESLGFEVQEQICPPDMYEPYRSAENPVYHIPASKYFGIVIARPKVDSVRKT